MLLHFLFSWFKWNVSFSTRPTPSKPRFGLNSSISLFWPQLAAAAAEKFNCLLKIAGNMLNCWWSRLRAVVGNDEPPPPPPPTEVPPTEPTPPAPGPPVPPDRSLARVMPGWPCWGLSNRMILTFFHHLPGHHPMFLFGGGTRSFSFLIYPFSFEFRSSISEDFCDFCRKEREAIFKIFNWINWISCDFWSMEVFFKFQISLPILSDLHQNFSAFF